MTTVVFGRGNFTQLWIKLTSDEPLGVLDTDYIEDYYGADGFLTLYHRQSTAEYQITMNEVPAETPGIPNDVFQGVYSPLSNLADGEYELRGRVRDPIGNYTILNAVQTPLGGERVLTLVLDIQSYSDVYTVDVGFLIARVGFQFDLSRADASFDLSRSFDVDFDLSRETSL